MMDNITIMMTAVIVMAIVFIAINEYQEKNKAHHNDKSLK